MPTTKKRYTYYLTVTQADGTKKQLRFTSVNKKNAQQKRDKAKWEYEAGLLVFNKKTTVAKYAETWIPQKRLDKDDISRLKRFCLDIIGHVPIGEVKATHIRSCFAEMTGLSKSTISKGRGIIKRMFTDMVVDELIPKNPCDRVAAPTGTVNARRAMTEEEEKAFLATLESRVHDGQHWYDIIFGISYACGLRPGEARALRRDHVFLDVPEPYLAITQSCKNTSTIIGSPKTKAGNRKVPIPTWFIPLLQTALLNMQDCVWVVPNTTGGILSHQTYSRRWSYFYRDMQKRYGAVTYRNRIISSPLGNELTPYYLRHTYCTNLVYMRIPEIVAMKWMGHDDPNMVRKIYADANNTKIMLQALSDLNTYNPLLASAVCGAVCGEESENADKNMKE